MGSAGHLNKFGHAMNEYFLFDPKYINLNHGLSVYGSAVAVLDDRFC